MLTTIGVAKRLIYTLIYFISFISIVLLPHWRVTQRQDPHEVKCLDIQFYDNSLTGNGCAQTLAITVIADAPHQFTGICPDLWPNCGMCPKPLYFLVALPNMAVGDNNAHFCFLLRDKVRSSGGAGWSEILCHLVCFMVALLLVLELTYDFMCNLSWWVPRVDQPQKHNPS